MKRIDIYPRNVGDTVELRVVPNGKLLGAVVFVKKYTVAGSHTESHHLPGANGEIQLQLTLQACKGYDLVFIGVPRPAGGASIQFEIAFNGPLAGQLSAPHSITHSKPSVGWTLLV